MVHHGRRSKWSGAKNHRNSMMAETLKSQGFSWSLGALLSHWLDGFIMVSSWFHHGFIQPNQLLGSFNKHQLTPSYFSAWWRRILGPPAQPLVTWMNQLRPAPTRLLSQAHFSKNDLTQQRYEKVGPVLGRGHDSNYQLGSHYEPSSTASLVGIMDDHRPCHYPFLTIIKQVNGVSSNL